MIISENNKNALSRTVGQRHRRAVTSALNCNDNRYMAVATVGVIRVRVRVMIRVIGLLSLGDGCV